MSNTRLYQIRLRRQREQVPKALQVPTGPQITIELVIRLKRTFTLTELVGISYVSMMPVYEAARSEVENLRPLLVSIIVGLCTPLATRVPVEMA